MSALICGSMAYDTIMVFHDKFKHHILPEKIHILNVSFLVPVMRREYGGCAGNIAYNLKLLGEEPLTMATVGHDFEPYAQWMAQNQLSSEFIKILDNSYTGQAYITTDEEANQITAFHPGAMNSSHLNSVPTDGKISIGIVSPDGKEGMQLHAEQFAELDIPFIFDPGQGMPMFNGEELLKLLDQATWVTLNDYESELMQERTGLSLEQMAERDSYRAGLLYGLMNELGWEVTGRVASLMGAIKIEHNGTQNHSFDMDGFKERYRENFGSSF
jgi:adenosine kinase